MIHDLILAVIAAFFVAFVPGYFWARLLCAGADPVQRVAYSVALSITLVPTVSLILTRIFGGGVSLWNAGASSLIVFVGGLLAYMWLRAPAAKYEPAGQPAYSLSPVALLPLLLSAGLMLYVLISARQPDPRYVLVMAALLAVSGLAQLGVVARRGPTLLPAESLRSLAGHPRAARVVEGVLFAAVIAVTLIKGYIGPLRHDWPFVRGVDQYSHAILAALVMSRGSAQSFMLYPPGFEFLTADLSRLSGLRPLEIFPVLAPATLVLPALACYSIARQLWGRPYGIAAAGIAGVLVNSPYLYFNDAMYPNLIGAEFLMVLAIAAFLQTIARPSWRWAGLSALLGASVVFYHTVSTIYLAVVIAVLAIIFVPLLLVRDRRRAAVVVLSLAALGVLSLAYAWGPYDLPAIVGRLVGARASSEALHSGAAVIGTQPPYDVWNVFQTITQPAIWLGILGAVLLAITIRRAGYTRALTSVALVIWAALMYWGSRAWQTGFPHRFERDAAIPIAILGAFGLVTVLRSLDQRRPVTAAALVVVLLAAEYQGIQNIATASGPSERLLTTPQIGAAGEWLREHNTGGTIIVSPKYNQVPSRAMLAMGGYTGLQTYSAWQLQQRRDLPPQGDRSLRDALWVLYHPESARDGAIFRKYDVRYIVLYKRFPDGTTWTGPPEIDWRPFAELKDRYRTVFENGWVLIVRPRRGAWQP